MNTGGTGTPEAAVTAPVGSLFLRTNGAAGTTTYTKATGTGNTGWLPLAAYAAGTWTPDITFGGAGVGVTYTARLGNYVSIGGWVTASVYVTLSSKGTSTGTLLVSLPVAPNTSLFAVCPVHISGYTAPAGTTTVMGYLGGGTFKLRAPSGTSSVVFTDAHVNNALNFVLTINYLAA